MMLKQIKFFLQKKIIVPLTIGYAGILDSSISSLDTTGKAAQLGGTKDLPTLIGNIISVVTGTMGIVFVVLVVYAGILYMTASGDDTKVKKAKTLLTQAVIGMIILVSAYAIASFVLSQIQGATISVGP